MKLSRLSDFPLRSSYYLPSFIFFFKLKHFAARKSFKCVEMLVSQRRLLKQHIVSTLPAPRTSCFNNPRVSAGGQLTPLFFVRSETCSVWASLSSGQASSFIAFAPSFPYTVITSEKRLTFMNIKVHMEVPVIPTYRKSSAIIQTMVIKWQSFLQ